LKTHTEKQTELRFDIKRSVILNSYVEQWGMPLYRNITTRKSDNSRIEVYSFPDEPNGLYRFATIGVSECKTSMGTDANWEVLYCLPLDLGGADIDEVINYLLDIVAYSLNDVNFFGEGVTIPASPLAPKKWSTSASLIDEPRGEPESLSHFCIGKQRVELLWIVPVLESERLFIKDKGIEAFDNLVSQSNASLINVNRSSIA
jgi:hypothetical protein